ncbi:hypothetical protein [Jiangella anatolica]|uniref:hypothetical protein n=1 Tax=Jiangella anatolica TaxID=2670374 RepID=UPI00131440AC|nr:hypothetical protein [Jiangella anatolica]
MSREAACTAADARQRARTARAYLDLAELAFAGEIPEANNVAAGNAVLAAVAASDALCCRRLGRLSRGQDHALAAQLLARIDPRLARHLTAALAVKDAAHYGAAFLTDARTKAALRGAAALVEAAEDAVR